MMKIKVVVTSVAQSNCYLVMDEETKKGIVIDPGDAAETIIARIKSMEMIPQAILMTHGHFDHILAADQVKEAFQIPTLIGEDDAAFAADPFGNHSADFTGIPRGMQADLTVKDGEILDDVFEIRVLKTPGHTVGGVCYYLPKENVVFTGDTLFYHSIGRTDFEGGSFEAITESIRTKLFTLPKDTKVFPGHGFSTTIGREAAENPFF